MAATNDVTGDKLKSKVANDNFRNNFDRIFGKPDEDVKEHKPKDWVKLGLSPSTKIEEWDCRK
jgi:hypothetical protein|tara:strand:- start:268 stop:456 length:189 start_codon:yes stop_codon:yes gene_type:complete